MRTNSTQVVIESLEGRMLFSGMSQLAQPQTLQPGLQSAISLSQPLQLGTYSGYYQEKVAGHKVAKGLWMWIEVTSIQANGSVSGRMALRTLSSLKEMDGESFRAEGLFQGVYQKGVMKFSTQGWIIGHGKTYLFSLGGSAKLSGSSLKGSFQMVSSFVRGSGTFVLEN